MTQTGSQTEQAGPLLAVGDLLLVAGYAIAVVVLALSGVLTGALRVLLVSALLGLCPGYAIVSALYPVTTQGEQGQPHTSWGHRVALAIGTSLFVLVLSALPLTALGFSTASVLGVMLAVTLVGVLVGAWRRLQIPADQRIRLPLGRFARDVRAATVEAPRLEAALNIALALVVIAGIATLAVGLAAPDRGTNYSEVALTNESGAAGNTTYVQDVQASVPLSVENNADEAQSYTAVVALERFGDGGGDGGAALLERSELSRSELTVPANETATSRLTFTPSMLGSELRLSVYVYVGSAPETPTPESADYHLYQWVAVEDEG